jgi:hypothetical protein
MEKENNNMKLSKHIKQEVMKIINLPELIEMVYTKIEKVRDIYAA